MPLQDYVDTSRVVEAIAAAAPYRTIEIALANARRIVQAEALANLKAVAENAMQPMYDMHVMLHGELVEGARAFQVDAWIGDLETQVTAFFDARASELSSNWLGTVDVRTPRNQKGLVALAESYANEAWRNLTYAHSPDGEGKEKSTAQILSSIGVVRADLEAFVDASTDNTSTPTETKKETNVVNYVTPEIVISTLHAAGLKGRELSSLLDNATDSDLILASSGLAGFMVFENVADIHAALLRLKSIHGFDALCSAIEHNTPLTLAPAPLTPKGEADELAAMMGGTADDLAAMFGAAPAVATTAPLDEMQALEAMMTAAPTVTTGAAPAPKATKATKAAKADAAPEAGVVPAAVLDALATASGANSTDLGAMIGVSRASFDNYRKGKGKLYVSEQILNTLITFVAERQSQLNDVFKQLNDMKGGAK